ncbi:MAG: hypothetical protein L6306_01635 [Planctomycetales bacterium]|nr:hypothetical protein [Planctomycetales bacterium]
MGKRLSERYYTDYVFVALDVDHDGDQRLQQTNPNPALFSVVFSIIGGDKHGHGEHFPCVNEVQSMFSDVGLVLVFVPFESH